MQNDMKVNMKILRPLLILAALLASACGGPSLTVNLAGLPNVNPDSEGRPSPVLVKMYELSGDLLFKNAGLLPLFQDPINTLGAELVSFDEFTLVPGEAKTLVYLPSPRTTHVGVAAGFRRQDQGAWKIVRAVDPEAETVMALELNGAGLVLLTDKEAKKWDPVEAVDSFRENPVQKAPALSTGPVESDLADPGDNYDDADYAVF